MISSEELGETGERATGKANISHSVAKVRNVVKTISDQKTCLAFI